MRLSLWIAPTLANNYRTHPIQYLIEGLNNTKLICKGKVICLKLARQKSNSWPKGIWLYQLPLRVELYFFSAHWTAFSLTFLCVETKLEKNLLLSNICSNCLAKCPVGTHFQNTWALKVLGTDVTVLQLRQLKDWVQNHAKWRSEVFFFFFAKVPEILHVIFNWIETHHPVFFFGCFALRFQDIT